MFNYKNKLFNISSLSSYFFNLNKWPIDKAPKVSNSSYLVGVGFVLLFHSYAFNTFDGFSAIIFDILGVNLQILSILLILSLWLTLSENETKKEIGIFFLFFLFIFIFIFFFYNNKVIVSNWQRRTVFFSSTYLVLNWDFFLFFFFFIGWVFKLSKKYSLESFTKNESFLYKSIAPSLFFFEFFTFLYCIVWRYINFSLVGYPTMMYLKVFKVTTVTGVVITKFFFYSSVYVAFITLILLLKNNKTTFFFLFYSVLIVYLTFFLIKEFKEIWGYLHSIAPGNTLKFTFFKYFLYILFFNFLHAYIVVLINYLIICVYISKNSIYSDSFEFIHLTIKNFYFIMWLTALALMSTYVITELGLYGV